MRAAVLWKDQGPMEVRDDVALVELGKRDVRVRLAATGICHTDLSVLNGTIRYLRPCILGHEGAGVVTAVGIEVERITPGDHAVVASVPACGKCVDCLADRPHLCRSASLSPFKHFELDGRRIAGVFGTGTFSEEIIVSADSVVRIDADVPLDQACLIGCGVMTGAGAALNSAQIVPGSSVVVFGMGGVGMAALQGARIAGAAEIVAVDPVQAKHQIARRLGATRAIVPDELEAVNHALTGGDGFDYALECVGSGRVIRQAYDVTRRGGTVVVVGVGKQEDIVPFSAYELFYSEKTLKGSMYGGAHIHRDFPRLVRLWRAGKLDLASLITQRFPLERINEALEVVRAGKAVRCVIDYASS